MTFTFFRSPERQQLERPSPTATSRISVGHFQTCLPESARVAMKRGHPMTCPGGAQNSHPTVSFSMAQEIPLCFAWEQTISESPIETVKWRMSETQIWGLFAPYAVKRSRPRACSFTNRPLPCTSRRERPATIPDPTSQLLDAQANAHAASRLREKNAFA